MKTVADLAAFLRADQVRHHKLALQYHERGDKAASVEQTEIVQMLREAIDFVSTLPEPAEQEKPSAEDLFSLNPLDLRNLPEEVRKDLKAAQDSEPDARILELLGIANRPVSIDELKVALFRKYQVTIKRTALSSRLYRLINQDRLVHSTERKGYYALGPAPTKQEEQ